MNEGGSVESLISDIHIYFNEKGQCVCNSKGLDASFLNTKEVYLLITKKLYFSQSVKNVPCLLYMNDF